MKIFSKGKKFDLGGGNQFDSIEDLIDHYKKYPFSVKEGAIIKIDQVGEHALKYFGTGVIAAILCSQYLPLSALPSPSSSPKKFRNLRIPHWINCQKLAVYIYIIYSLKITFLYLTKIMVAS